MGVRFWSKAILLVDMDAFFAAIEQLDNPELRGRPVVITNGECGSTIITSSYEARCHGIKTGMPLWQARQLCAHLVRCGTRPERYAEISTKIMQVLATFSPDLEIFSIDEAFLDVTCCQRLHGLPLCIARKIKQAIFHETGLTCSVGVSGDKTTAKYAAGCSKPNGCMAIPPWQAQQYLANLPVTALCGVGKGIGCFLAQYGVVTCAEMAQLPIGLLAKRFGNFGRRLWYMCRGADPYPVTSMVPEAKSMGHGKVLPPGVCDQKIILSYFHCLSERLAARLRRHDCQSQLFFIGMLVKSLGWLGGKYRTAWPTHDGQHIYRLCRSCVHEHGAGFVVQQVQVTALSLDHSNAQLDLFLSVDEQAEAVNRVMDGVNHRFGTQALVLADRLMLGDMVPVIAPSWQPRGPRRSIS